MFLDTTRQFERDLRRAVRRRKDLALLWAVANKLLAGQPLDPRNRLHRLTGNWVGHWECHIEHDWLLIWRQNDDCILLVATGTHSDLYG